MIVTPPALAYGLLYVPGMRRNIFLAFAIGALGIGGCGSNNPAPPVGTWTFSGGVPAIITIALTFNPEGNFSAVEQVAPPTSPAGAGPAPGCATTDSYSGTYDVSDAGGKNTVTWTYGTGTVNAIEGCDDASLNTAGTTATPDGIASYTAQNILPPATEAYAETQTTLFFTPGFGPSTSFVKSATPGAELRAP
jgi:hypothetical protein